MLLQQFLITALAIVATVCAVDVPADMALNGTSVVLVVDAVDITPDERANILTFTKGLSVDMTKKGANVGLLLGGDSYITDSSEFKQLSLEKRLDRVQRFHQALERTWQFRDDSQDSGSTLAESLTNLEARLSYMKNRPKVVAVLITGAKKPNFVEIGNAYTQLEPYKVRFSAILLGRKENADELSQLTESKCFVTLMPSAEHLASDLKGKARVVVVLRLLANGVENVEDDDSLCRQIYVDTLNEFRGVLPQPVTVKPVETTTTERPTQPPVEELVREAIESVLPDDEPSKPEEDKEAAAEKLRKQQAEEEEAENIRKEEEFKKQQAQENAEKLRKQQEEEAAEKLRKQQAEEEAAEKLRKQQEEEAAEKLRKQQEEEEAENIRKEEELKEKQAEKARKEDELKKREAQEVAERLRKQQEQEEAENVRKEEEFKKKQAENRSRLERERIEREQAEELFQKQAELDLQRRRKEETSEKMHPVRAEKVLEDQEMIEENAVKETAAGETTTSAGDPLMCYRCDGCGENTPDSKQVARCGSVGMAMCYLARIGFGKDVTFVRGCEQRGRCVDVDSPVLKRKCCSTPLCNGEAPPEHRKTKKAPRTKPTPKTTTPPPTTTMETIPPVEVAKSLVSKDEIDSALPFSNVEVYYLVDFAGLSKGDRKEMIESAKRLAVDSATLGAEVSIVNGHRVRRISPYQIHVAFENARKRPVKEDILRRFESELHIDPEAPLETQSKGRPHQYYTTTAEPSPISTIPQTFESVVDKLLSKQDRSDADVRRNVFIVFMSGAELPQIAGVKLWESHERIANLSPHYMSLLVGTRTSADPFIELVENSDNPRCLVMRFGKMATLTSAETELELSKLLVESVDYVREHDTLATFRCGAEPAPPVVRTREPSTTTEPTTETATEETTDEPTTEQTTEPVIHPIVVVPDPSDSAKVIIVEPENEKPVDETEVVKPKTESAEETKPVRTVVEVDVVDKNGDMEEKIVVVPKPKEGEEAIKVLTPEDEPKKTDEETLIKTAEEEVTTPQPERRVVVVVREDEEDRSKQLTPQEQPTEEERIEKIVSKVEEPVRVDNTEIKKKEDLTVVIVEPKSKQQVVEIRKMQKKNVVEDDEFTTPTTSTTTTTTTTEKTTTEKTTTNELPRLPPQPLKKGRNGTLSRSSGKGGKLMCYQCEHCNAARPSSSSVVECGDGDPTSPKRGVCFIQRVGNEYSRGCIEGYECLETQSETLTNYCCNSHSLCNDVLPSSQTNVIGKASSAVRVSSISLFAAFSLLLLLL